MLTRRLATYMRHGRRLQRHVSLRRVAAVHVYGTTPIPFLQRIGLVEVEPLHSAHAHRLPHAGGRAPLEGEPRVKDFEHQELSLMPAGDGTTSLDETSQARTLAAVEEVSAPEGAELFATEAPPGAGFVRSSKSESQVPRAVPEKKVSEPARSRTIPLGQADLASDRLAPDKEASSADFELSKTRPDRGTAPEPPRSARPPRAAEETLQADKSKGSTAVPTRGTASQNSPAGLLPLRETTGAPPNSGFANQVSQVDEEVSKVSEPVTEGMGKAPEDISHLDVTQGHNVLEQSSLPTLSRPEGAPAVISRRRAYVQEMPAELKPQAVVAAQRRSRSTSQANVRGPKQSSSAAAPEVEVEAAEARELFVRRDDTDRSPSAWRERLTEAIRVTNENERKEAIPPATRTGLRDPHPAVSKLVASRVVDHRAVAAPRPINAQPVRMPESARRFLSPLIGMDVRDIPIYEGPEVSRSLAARDADAIAANDSILLGPGHETGDAKTLGLLAHELTHIARGREAKFVPPVVRGPVSRGSTASLPGTIDEESLAQRVESRTMRASEHDLENSTPGMIKGATQPILPISVTSPETPIEVSPQSSGSQESWGGLPAPWDPIPEWVSAPHVAQSARLGSLHTAGTPSVSAAVAALPDGSAAPARAESGRSLPDIEESTGKASAGAHEPAEGGKHVQPDLDALARQVYTLVRRRLAADRRRESMQ